MDGSGKELEFSWGKRRGIGGAKKDIHFYESFTLDNVKYSLFDSVYLFKTGDPEPYIGKIAKIWEQNKARKVKIIWFFLPDEIQKYLNGPVMEKELFLASGNGPGLADVNPLEAIAGKCTVICISKDKRNRQPSPLEQEVADYIFYRFFDVQNCTISDLLPDEIAGLKVDSLLNPKNEEVTSISIAANVKGGMAATATAPPPQSVVKEGKSSVAAVKEENENMSATVSLPQSVVMGDKKPADIPIRPFVVKKEHSRPLAVPRFQSADNDDENDKPVTIAPPPRSAARENIPKHKQNAFTGDRPSKKFKSTQETMQSVEPVVPEKKPLDLTSRHADRSKWFNIPWDQKLKIADEQGKLVYIQNLDIQFAAADIEELIREALQLNCTAKPINHPTYDDPNNGKAYAIFGSKSDADTAISKINSGLVVGGRPIYCSKGLLKVAKQTGPLVGHLSLNSVKIGQKQREEQKKAVSTSHCSQPNTLEYDLALDWMVIREKQEIKFRILHKRHEDERKRFANMGSKNAKIGK